MGIVFSVETLKAIRRFLKNNNYHVIALLMFYEHIKTTFSRVLGYVVYQIIDKYVCLDYLFLHKDKLF